MVVGCCDLLKNIYLCGSNNNLTEDELFSAFGCDLLKNIYLCGSNNNAKLELI